ncbi:hypothetical protein [Amnibacterium kyonggiense]
MRSGPAGRRAEIELVVVALPGVRALYPTSPLPGAPKVVLVEHDGATRCELRIAAEHDVPSVELIRAVTEAVRLVAEDDALELRIELASID